MPTREKMNIGSEVLKIPLLSGAPDMDLGGQGGWSQREQDLKGGNPNRPSRPHGDTVEKKLSIYLSFPKGIG